MSAMKLGNVTVDHPGAQGRARGEGAVARLQLWTAGGADRSIVLGEDDLVRLAAQSLKVLAILKGVRT